jgi:thiol:disulfide interchange protein DsbD
MKRLICLILFLLSLNSFAQILNPVKWDIRAEKVSATEYDLIFSANIDQEWAIYSQFVGDDGPLPTVFSFIESSDYLIVGNTQEKELNRVSKYDEVFEMVVTKFFDKAIFSQRIDVVKSSSNFKIQGNIEFMTCDDTRCTYEPENNFVIDYDPNNGLNVSESSKIKQGVADLNSNISLYGKNSSFNIIKSDCSLTNDNLSEDIKKASSFWNIFGLGFIGGLLALLTPCVFPMIPLTVSFFTKKNEGASNQSGFIKALLYGVFIFLVYLILSVPFHLLDSVNPDILNDISTNVWLNIFFFLIFVIFAFSFFGYYELTLPNSWTSLTTKGERFGGVIGVFFMALTLSIVSFSCTGPILGSLLAGSLSADGGAWQLTYGMAGFGLALGLPFAFFAMFPNMLKALPSSGGWLNTTKVILGFLELALAFKFLSNADLVQHWGILKIEAFLIIWILIFLAMALYVFRKLKMPHDGPLKKLTYTRLCSGVLILSFVFYLGSGFKVNRATKSFSSLTLLSGLAPPVGYSFLYPNDCPNNFECFKDFKEGVAYANKMDKPIILDFTGYACVNCRKMEEHIWPKGLIKPYFEEEYVLISLYVDDKKTLPVSEQLTVNKLGGGVRQLKNYGHKWSHFQTEFFQSNSQPFYVLLSSDASTILTPPVGYTPDVAEYEAFLKCGLDTFKGMK